MSFSIASKLLRQSMTDSLAGVFPQVVYDALDIASLPTSQRAASITMEFGEAQLRSFGKKSVRIVGTAHVRLYEPSGNGDGDQLKIADSIIESLRNMNLAEGDVEVKYFIGTLSNAARAGAHWERVVHIPFRVTYYTN